MDISIALGWLTDLFAGAVGIVNQIFEAVPGSVDYLLIVFGIFFSAAFLIKPLRGAFVSFAGSAFSGSSKNQKHR